MATKVVTKATNPTKAKAKSAPRKAQPRHEVGVVYGDVVISLPSGHAETLTQAEAGDLHQMLSDFW